MLFAMSGRQQYSYHSSPSVSAQMTKEKKTQTHLVFSKISHLILKVSWSIYKRHMKPMSKSHPPITSSASQEAHFLDWAGGKPDALHVESRFALNDVLYNLNGQSWKNGWAGSLPVASAKLLQSFWGILPNKNSDLRVVVVNKKTKKTISTWFSHHSLTYISYFLDQVQCASNTKKNTLVQLGMHIVDHDPSKRPSDDLAFQTSTSSPQEIGEADL